MFPPAAMVAGLRLLQRVRARQPAGSRAASQHRMIVVTEGRELLGGDVEGTRKAVTLMMWPLAHDFHYLRFCIALTVSPTGGPLLNLYAPSSRYRHYGIGAAQCDTDSWPTSSPALTTACPRPQHSVLPHAWQDKGIGMSLSLSLCQWQWPVSARRYDAHPSPPACQRKNEN
jgi:hypothetical protein